MKQISEKEQGMRNYRSGQHVEGCRRNFAPSKAWERASKEGDDVVKITKRSVREGAGPGKGRQTDDGGRKGGKQTKRNKRRRQTLRDF